MKFKHVTQKIGHFREFLKNNFQDVQKQLNSFRRFMFLDHFGQIYRAKCFVKSKTPNVSKKLKENFQRCSKNCKQFWNF
jgi:hypothetical protein